MLGTELKFAEEQIGLLTSRNQLLRGEISGLQAKEKEMELKLRILKGVSIRGLTVAEAAAEIRKTLEAENKTLKEANDKFMAELKARCEKLSIQVNGQNHKPEIFVKEIAALSADEIRAKITGLERQWASQYRSGRIIGKQSSPAQVGIGQPAQFDPILFRIS